MEKIRSIRKKEANILLFVFIALVAVNVLMVVNGTKLVIWLITLISDYTKDYRAGFGIYGPSFGGEIFLYPIIVIGMAWLMTLVFDMSKILYKGVQAEFDDDVKDALSIVHSIRNSNCITNVIDFDSKGNMTGHYYKGNDGRVHYRAYHKSKKK